jgi:hypothetical protein
MKRSGIRLLTNFAPQDLVTGIQGSVTPKIVVFGRAEFWALGLPVHRNSAVQRH